MKAKPQEQKQAAVKLRQEGKSIREIAELLSISKSTASIWVKNVQLTEDQISKLFARNPIGNPVARLRGIKKWCNVKREKRLHWQMGGRQQAKKKMVTCSGLYALLGRRLQRSKLY